MTLSLHGPKGEWRGAMLDDGASLHMPPLADDVLREYLAPGSSVCAWGRGIRNRFGRVVEVDEIAFWVNAAVMVSAFSRDREIGLRTGRSPGVDETTAIPSRLAAR